MYWFFCFIGVLVSLFVRAVPNTSFLVQSEWNIFAWGLSHSFIASSLHRLGTNSDLVMVPSGAQKVAVWQWMSATSVVPTVREQPAVVVKQKDGFWKRCSAFWSTGWLQSILQHVTASVVLSCTNMLFCSHGVFSHCSVCCAHSFGPRYRLPSLCDSEKHLCHGIFQTILAEIQTRVLVILSDDCCPSCSRYVS
jgi:hypothetical protein